MSAVAFLTLVAILCEASAQNVTTSLIIPNGLFNPTPRPQTFLGEATVSGHATYYTLNCGDYRDPDVNFWPGEYGCPDNSYTISADTANTQFLMPNVTYDVLFPPSSGAAPSQLEAFAQTITINCAPSNANLTANCAWTNLYNNENTGDKSIIKPTIVTQSSIYAESSLYAIILTTTVAAAAKPSNSLASATTANPIPPKISTTTSFLSSSSTPPPPSHSPLSTGTKAGIGIGVSLGLIALAGTAILLYAHNKHRQRSRLSQTENLMPFEGGVGEFERKEVSPPDNSGVYEMEGRQSPVRVGELESPVHGGEMEG